MGPWGRPFVYRCPGLHNTNSLTSIPAGKTGRARAAARIQYDINNWNRNSLLVGSDGGAWPAIAGGLGLSGSAGAGMGGKAVLEIRGQSSWCFRLPFGLLTAPPLRLVLEKTQLGRDMGYLWLVVFIGWFIPLFFWTISGERRGSPLSKTCAFVAIILLLRWLVLAGFVLPHWV